MNFHYGLTNKINYYLNFLRFYIHPFFFLHQSYSFYFLLIFKEKENLTYYMKFILHNFLNYLFVTSMNPLFPLHNLLFFINDFHCEKNYFSII